MGVCSELVGIDFVMWYGRQMLTPEVTCKQRGWRELFLVVNQLRFHTDSVTKVEGQQPPPGMTNTVWLKLI